MDFTGVPMLKIWPILADTDTDINIGTSLNNSAIYIVPGFRWQNINLFLMMLVAIKNHIESIYLGSLILSSYNINKYCNKYYKLIYQEIQKQACPSIILCSISEVKAVELV